MPISSGVVPIRRKAAALATTLILRLSPIFRTSLASNAPVRLAFRTRQHCARVGAHPPEPFLGSTARTAHFAGARWRPGQSLFCHRLWAGYAMVSGKSVADHARSEEHQLELQ